MNRSTSQDSVVHGTFSVERTYPSLPSRVFAAFSDRETKRRWFAEGEGWEVEEFAPDFRVGGREFSCYRFEGGAPIRNETVYQDIVPDRRIVFAYTIEVGGERISASLGTVEISPSGDGSRLVYTEQGAFFEGTGKPEEREAGCRELFERLEEELRGHP
jgi:uncharacterized protein YndB with AHSA1/START domain